MKTISPALAAHLKQQVTTICTCIYIRRRDGKSFHFTDHDTVLPYANTVYVPYDSFARFSIASSLEMSVDILEIRGMLSTLAVSRDDIASGLFDWSNIIVFAVNYEEPSMGRVILRAGHLGEFTMDEDGTFHAEIRGLAQVYANKIGEVYQAECRADLGDRRCRVPLSPPQWLPLTAYCKDSVIVAPINPALGYVNLGIVNASFEDDGAVAEVAALTGWTSYGDTTAGQWGTFDSTSGPVDFGGVPAPKQGSYFAGHRNFIDVTTGVTHQSVELGMYQDVALVTSGITTGDIDTGLCRLTATLWYARANSSNTTPQFQIFALDATGAQITVVYDSGGLGGAEDTWLNNIVADALIPTGTRALRFDLFSRKQGSNFAGSGFDSLSVAVNTPSGTLGSADQYGGVAFKATTAGVSGGTLPAFSNLLGSTTVDGSVTWVCVKSFAEVATVTALSTTSTRVFTPSSLTGVSGYYDGGFIVWESGRNAGIAQEVNTWNGTTLTLFARPFHAPAIGDRFVIHPGCDHTRATCHTKFNNVANFRGEPDVPGMDEYMKTPNADGSTGFFINAGAV